MVQEYSGSLESMGWQIGPDTLTFDGPAYALVSTLHALSPLSANDLAYFERLERAAENQSQIKAKTQKKRLDAARVAAQIKLDADENRQRQASKAPSRQLNHSSNIASTFGDIGVDLNSGSA